MNTPPSVNLGEPDHEAMAPPFEVRWNPTYANPEVIGVLDVVRDPEQDTVAAENGVFGYVVNRDDGRVMAVIESSRLDPEERERPGVGNVQSVYADGN